MTQNESVRIKKNTFFGMPWTFTTYYLYESKIITTSGILVRVREEIQLYKILDKRLSISIVQKMFGIGTIKVYSGDIEKPTKEFVNVKNPEVFFDILDELVTATKQKMGIAGIESIRMRD